MKQYTVRPATFHVYIVRANKKNMPVLEARRKKIKRERYVEPAGYGEEISGPSRKIGSIHKRNTSTPGAHIPTQPHQARPNFGASARPSGNFPEDNFVHPDPVRKL